MNLSILKITVSIMISVILICFIIEYKKENYNNNIPYTIEENYINYNNSGSKNNNKVYNIYWTGGYDSTYRLCEMLLSEGKTVQPIYVSLVLDNDCKTEESCDKLWLRRNRKEEKKAMENIIKLLNNKFPFTKDTLLPLLEVDQNIQDDKFNYEFDNLFYKDNLWPKKRKTHQYLFLSKYAYYHKKDIDIGVLGIHEKSKFAKFLRDNLVKIDNNFCINDKSHPLGYLSFPLYGRTKEILLDQSRSRRFDDILQATWSCWFPKNGKPCKKCPMCRERIVSHPNLN